MNAKAKPVLMVMGTRHVRMDHLSKELKERFGQISCTGYVDPFSRKSKLICNKDLDLSEVGNDPLDALHIWVIDGDSNVLVSPFKGPSKRYDIVVGCRSRAKRFELLPTNVFELASAYTTVFYLTCNRCYNLLDRNAPTKVFKFWTDYYKNKLGVRVVFIAQLTLPVPKTVVICNIDTASYEAEALKKKL